MQEPPPGQGPIDPRGAFSPPPPPGGTGSSPPGYPPAPGYAAPSPQGFAPPGFGPPGYPPPPYFGPPMPMMYPPPKPPRSFARAIFTTLATTILGVSLLLNLYLLAFSGLMNSGTGQREKIIEKGDPKNRIVVLSVSGIINDDAFDTFHKQLKALEDDKTLRALVVEVNSPGGSVTASDEIHQDILRFKQKVGKPVVIYQRGLAASGGYYVSCAGDFIVAQRTTMTGNIGVLLPRYNVKQMLDKWGVQDTTLRSEDSPFKNVPSMTLPPTPEGEAYLQAIIEDAYDQFTAVVQAGRGSAMKAAGVTSVKEIANGKIYLAEEAAKLGLVDLVGDADAAYAQAIRLAKLGGIKPTIVKINDLPGLLDLLGVKSPVGSGGGGVEFNAVKLDAASVREMLLPRLMYLWDGQ